MSKKKKTISELLEEVSIPKEEQLYALPENWTWIQLQNCLDSIQYGYTETSSIQEIGPKFLRITDIQNDCVNWSDVPFCKITDKELQKYRLANNDIVVARTGATTGKSYLINKPPMAVFASYLIRLRCRDIIIPNYLWEFMKSPMYWKQITIVKKGSAQPGANAKILGNLAVPLPPLNEQKRITEKVERLLNKIEDAKQLIEEAKETFELRRSAILDMAFRGRRSRDFKGLPNGWEYKNFDEIATVKSNLVNPNDYLDYPHIAPNNIEKHTGRLLEYNTIREDNVKSVKHYFKSGAILYSKIRPYLSKVAMVDFEGLCSADMYPIESQLNSKYLYWFMLSPLFLEQATTAGSRSVLPKINQKELGKVMVPVCSDEEQVKTVKIIESVLKEENIILSRIENTLSELTSLKQSVISQAFKGRLGTGNPNDESAIELLKSVLQEKL
ncbi:restriction endonuclease subunit S [Bacillus toyonensis]|uniref:restriction endonuclease subunit S n=1 Tax=Bacillus toyonensis TaxID=155322 RepID=UPI0018A17933|nr:restriction endonuclease subunit S [Bacillus toyonensis]MBF7149974.1 restriction endonuclease subunit S [Bacillus toyonensis]MEC2351917.1 restriction endonuclease subunit S [Bacillus toyonensis]MED3189446.1 restriction endonuclease subunit S [Bacillus toyonensis]